VGYFFFAWLGTCVLALSCVLALLLGKVLGLYRFMDLEFGIFVRLICSVTL
jgi:hypothetical protein